MMALFLSDITYLVREREGRKEIGKSVVPDQVMIINNIPLRAKFPAQRSKRVSSQRGLSAFTRSTSSVSKVVHMRRL